MLTFKQSTGALSDSSGSILQMGYAGKGDGKNNPAMQDVHDVGPLPQGLYTIESPYDSPKTGPFTMNLVPDPANNMFGRAGFRLHGDSMAHPGDASDGCIVLSRVTRDAIWKAGDFRLQVIA